MDAVPCLLWLTGASGSGKTTLARMLRQRLGAGSVVEHFDAIGVPSLDEMTRVHGSPKRWQIAMTIRWIERAASGYPGSRAVVIEGQTEPLLVLAEARRRGLPRVEVVLVCCDDEERHRRLVELRRQPELCTADMDAWARLLRAQAEVVGAMIVDTTRLDPHRATDAVVRRLEVHVLDPDREALREAQAAPVHPLRDQAEPRLQTIIRTIQDRSCSGTGT